MTNVVLNTDAHGCAPQARSDIVMDASRQPVSIRAAHSAIRVHPCENKSGNVGACQLAVRRADFAAMSEPVEDLMVDFLAWLAPGAKPYGEVMEAWRTSCPRLTVWEEALDAHFVARRPAASVALTDAGRAWLAARSSPLPAGEVETRL
jgi:hypothetical protein